MNILNWNHPDISQNQNSALVSQANAGESTLTVLNAKGFAVNKILLIGTFGSEDAEIVKTHASTAPTDTVITLAAALKFSHTTDTPVTILDYDQIEVSRAASEGGSYAVLSTVDITPDEDATSYRDANGATTDYYKIRYKNSIDSSYSGYSSEVPASGFAEETLAGMVEAVFAEFSTKSKKILDRSDIVRWLNEGADKLYSKIIDLGIDYFVKYGTDGNGTLLSFTANTRTISLPSDFVRAKLLEATYDGVTYYPMRPMDATFDLPANVYSKTDPRYFFEGEKIVPRPTPTASVGGIRPRYVYKPAKMANDSDKTELPIGHRTTPVNYALQKAFQSDNKMDVAGYYGQLFLDGAEIMLSEIKNRYPEAREHVPMFGESLDDQPFDGFQIPT